MKSALSILLAALAMVSAGCGGDDTSDGATTTGGDAHLSGPQMNGCTDADLKSVTEIAFSGTTYTPNCVKVAKGGTVTWKGDFVSHPLQGGASEGTGTPGTPDSSSPIGSVTMGMEKAITFPASGTFGFYCTVHGGVGMRGAILVE
jgi:plastocyanin